MSKYEKLWNYIKCYSEDSLCLSFDELEKIAGVGIDHSFLRYKKELTKNDWTVEKISMKEQRVTFKKMLKNALILYVHGKGGNAAEAEHYKLLFPDCDVVGLEYRAQTQWEAEKEFPLAVNELFARYSRVVLIANSIGAYFSMCALPQEKIERAYFISPIVDMERLICNMMNWAKVTESELCRKEEIETDFGETLSWKYLCYVRSEPVVWSVPTKILYGENDNLTDQKTITDFANAHKAQLVIMPNGEHWFHTTEQMAFLDKHIGSDF